MIWFGLYLLIGVIFTFVAFYREAPDTLKEWFTTSCSILIIIFLYGLLPIARYIEKKRKEKRRGQIPYAMSRKSVRRKQK